ncbi:MAG: metal-dependent transcriptional regulator [Nitrososphaerota archaeon]|nr:metal-dependent transcriptional regulator [Aigarchaeota archaeon]MDW8076542.1 metal-dependent transcriptional regulator [Nitrososphaerota archaeon]
MNVADYGDPFGQKSLIVRHYLTFVVPKNLSRVESCYLKRIYVSTIEEGRQITSGDLAKIFNVKIPSAIDVLNKLEKKIYIKKEKYGYITLTQAGYKVAVELLHAHRVFEVFLVNNLKMKSNEACRIADYVDHVLDKEVVSRLCAYLNRPMKCCHNRTIIHIGCEARSR